MKTTTTYTIEALEIKIAELKLSSNKKDFYKMQNLKEELSWMKATVKGNFVTKEDLVELKPLIIFMIRKSSFYGATKDILKEVMTQLLIKVEGNSVIFRTKKGIKGIITNLVKGLTQDLNYDLLVTDLGDEVLTNSNFRMTNPRYKAYQNFYLDLNA